ncbi:protein of unknown function [Paraburkholderia dioscoreae]|uniref:Uncharacterized protein n=1 Tax=Paraburkholderia dioscoreae TaxID=2604047 RepID=A0A5Q4ZNW3_9BURK|nr:protein of unknown function [Paraburkholderia dioscoreae]
MQSGLRLASMQKVFLTIAVHEAPFVPDVALGARASPATLGYNSRSRRYRQPPNSANRCYGF